MDSQTIISVLVGALLVLLLTGHHVFAAIGVAGAMALILMGDVRATVGSVMWFTTASWDLSSMTLFILMGEIISRCGISESLYRVGGHWLARLPGGLLHSNVITAALLSSLSGSTIAVTATVGAVAIPGQGKLGYNSRLVIGSVAASGLLGILIPPSINMIIYAIWVEISIGKLFMGGVIPGLLLASMFMAYIALVCWKNPSLAPRSASGLSSEEMLHDFRHGVLPLIILFAIIWGGIFSGWMTATEAAGVAAIVACVIAAVSGKLSWPVLRDSMLGTLRITCMVMAIMIGAKLVAVAVAYAGTAGWVLSVIKTSGLGALPVVFILYGIYILLGCFLDGISMMLLTLPFVVPILQSVGVDLLWFGVILVVLIEIGFLTPPVGISLFVVSGIAHASVSEVIMSILPFLLILLGFLLIVTFFPDIVTFLPRIAMG